MSSYGMPPTLSYLQPQQQNNMSQSAEIARQNAAAMAQADYLHNQQSSGGPSGIMSTLNNTANGLQSGDNSTILGYLGNQMGMSPSVAQQWAPMGQTEANGMATATPSQLNALWNGNTAGAGAAGTGQAGSGGIMGMLGNLIGSGSGAAGAGAGAGAADAAGGAAAGGGALDALAALAV